MDGLLWELHHLWAKLHQWVECYDWSGDHPVWFSQHVRRPVRAHKPPTEVWHISIVFSGWYYRTNCVWDFLALEDDMNKGFPSDFKSHCLIWPNWPAELRCDMPGLSMSPVRAGDFGQQLLSLPFVVIYGNSFRCYVNLHSENSTDALTHFLQADWARENRVSH